MLKHFSIDLKVVIFSYVLLYFFPLVQIEMTCEHILKSSFIAKVFLLAFLVLIPVNFEMSEEKKRNV